MCIHKSTHIHIHVEIRSLMFSNPPPPTHTRTQAVQAPVYEVTKGGDCYWLGQTKSMEWELIDETEPAAGVELYYFDGEQCAGGVAREFINIYIYIYIYIYTYIYICIYMYIY